MDILDRVSIKLPCQLCGSTYEVALKDVDRAQRMLTEGCPVADNHECLPLDLGDLVGPDAIRALGEAWAGVERAVAARGGSVILAAGDSGAQANQETGPCC